MTFFRKIINGIFGKSDEPQSWADAIRRRFREHDQERRWAVNLQELDREGLSLTLVKLTEKMVTEIAHPHYHGKARSEWPLTTVAARRFGDQLLSDFIIAAFLPMLKEENQFFDRDIPKAYFAVAWLDTSLEALDALMEGGRKVDSVTRVMSEIIQESQSGAEPTRAMYQAMLDAIWQLARNYVWTGERVYLDRLSSTYPMFAGSGFGRWILVRHERGDPIYGLSMNPPSSAHPT